MENKMKNFVTFIKLMSLGIYLTLSAPLLHGSYEEKILEEQPRCLNTSIFTLGKSQQAAFFVPSETNTPFDYKSIEFPPIHQKEKIQEYLNIPIDEEYVKRHLNALETLVDRTDIPFITIDCATTKDRDDAIAVVANEDNGHTIYVAVAHVPFFVDQFSPVDLTAFQKAETNYEHYDPMFPEELSTNICSLHPGVKRAAIVYEMILKEDGTLENKSIAQAIIQSRSAQYYGKIDKFLQKKKYPYLKEIHKAASLLYLNRLKGMPKEVRPHHMKDLEYFTNVNFENTHKYLSLKGFGNTTATYWSENIICEFMLAANRFSARFISQKYELGMFRGHFRGNKVEEGHAYYTHFKNRYHEALGMGEYSHSTSPIRRYPDVILQRLIVSALENKETPYSSMQLALIAGHCTAIQHNYYGEVESDQINRLPDLITIEKLPQFYKEIVEPTQPDLKENNKQELVKSKNRLHNRKRSVTFPPASVTKVLPCLEDRQTSLIPQELTTKIVDNEIYTVETLQNFGLSNFWITYFAKNGYGEKKYQAINIHKRVSNAILREQNLKKLKNKKLKFNGKKNFLTIPLQVVYHFVPL